MKVRRYLSLTVASLALSGVTIVSSADPAEAARKYQYTCEVSGGGDEWDGRTRTGSRNNKKTTARNSARNRVLNQSGWRWYQNESGSYNVWNETTWEVRVVEVSCWRK